MKIKVKKMLMICMAVSILLVSAISLNAKNIKAPEFNAIDLHNAQVLELFEPDDTRSTVMFATLMNNKAAERTDYVVSDIYAWQDMYTDAIFFYESPNLDWNDAVHLNLTNNIFSFKLSSPTQRGEQLAVIFDDGESVWIEYLTEDDFYDNMYWVKNVYTLDYIDVKVIAYLDDYNQYGVPMRYAYVLAEQHVESYSPNSGNIITSFTLPGQLGDTIIDSTEGTIIIFMPAGSDVTSLKPSVTYSSKASVWPSVTSEQDFTKEVVYTVSAEDYTKTTYTVYVIGYDNPTREYMPIYHPLIRYNTNLYYGLLPAWYHNNYQWWMSQYYHLYHDCSYYLQCDYCN